VTSKQGKYLINTEKVVQNAPRKLGKNTRHMGEKVISDTFYPESLPGPARPLNSDLAYWVILPTLPIAWYLTDIHQLRQCNEIWVIFY